MSGWSSSTVRKYSPKANGPLGPAPTEPTTTPTKRSQNWPRRSATGVVYTRYVAPIPPKDAWVDYFKDWPQFLVPPDDPIYDLTDETAALAEGHQVVDRTTFGKWGQQLIDAIGGAKKITVCGVATDCCVLTTVLAAADNGVAVRVPADACAGSTPENQELALNTMRLFEPLITVTDTASILA